MNNQKLIPIMKGMIKHIPGVKKIMSNRKIGTIESRYCYSVWMRHLINWNNFNNKIPESVAELGPGESLGTGLAALLSGSKHFYALDVVKYWDNKRNLEIFEELIDLFRNKTDVPDNMEYPKIKPQIENYNFPLKIISDKILDETLSENRLNAVRKEILDINNPDNTIINYHIPWYDSEVVKYETIDFIYSQAVLEHVEDMDNTYSSMKRWLKSSGLMSHSIDFKSHGITKSWNGHWMFSDFEWEIVKGGKVFLINRQPVSKHIELHEKYGFKVLVDVPVEMENKLNIKQFSRNFKTMSDKDITTSGVYILSKKV